MRETKNISFTPKQARFVEERVESGRYQSASEVVREGLRLLDQHEQEQQARVEALRGMIRQGADEIDQGKLLDGPAVMAESRERLSAKAAKLNDAS